MTSKEALKRIETILQPNNIYKQYTDSETVFHKDCDWIMNDLDKLEAYESVMLEVIDLLEIEGRGTKQKAKERLKGVLEKWNLHMKI